MTITNSLAVNRTKSLATHVCCPRERAVLIDDDPAYRELFVAAGKDMGVSIKAYNSLADMNSFSQLKLYEFAVIDYHLESFKGTEIADYVDVFFPELPVFLISADDSIASKKLLPYSVKKFFNKVVDPNAILRETLKVVDQLRFYDEQRMR